LCVVCRTPKGKRRGLQLVCVYVYKAKAAIFCDPLYAYACDLQYSPSDRNLIPPTTCCPPAGLPLHASLSLFGCSLSSSDDGYRMSNERPTAATPMRVGVSLKKCQYYCTCDVAPARQQRKKARSFQFLNTDLRESDTTNMQSKEI